MAPKILQYANMADGPHYAWQPLITWLNTAFKNGKTADKIEASGSASEPIGVMWYRGMLDLLCEHTIYCGFGG
jgi:hypothetical protein